MGKRIKSPDYVPACLPFSVLGYAIGEFYLGSGSLGGFVGSNVGMELDKMVPRRMQSVSSGVINAGDSSDARKRKMTL